MVNMVPPMSVRLFFFCFFLEKGHPDHPPPPPPPSAHHSVSSAGVCVFSIGTNSCVWLMDHLQKNMAAE